jgi:hypothetical protein
VTCDDVREQLAEHLLGTLDPGVDASVDAHLRGCSSCRREVAVLADGVGSFALASHDREPPGELRDRVLGVLDEEWRAEAPPRAPAPRRWVASALAIAAAIAAIAWAGVATVRADRFESAAAKYESFLGVLGGENVRVGELHRSGPEALQGSVVMYDSNVGQSWVLVLCRAPGWSGSANVTLHANDGRTIDLHPMEFGGGGEGSTWLVTSSDLRAFDRVTVWTDRGVLATASVEPDRTI